MGTAVLRNVAATGTQQLHAEFQRVLIWMDTDPDSNARSACLACTNASATAAKQNLVEKLVGSGGGAREKRWRVGGQLQQGVRDVDLITETKRIFVQNTESFNSIKLELAMDACKVYSNSEYQYPLQLMDIRHKIRTNSPEKVDIRIFSLIRT